MLKLKLQYLGHLMQTADSLERTLRLGKIVGKRRRTWQRMRWWYVITNSMDMSLSKRQETVKNRQSWHAAVHGVAKSQTQLSKWTKTTVENNMEFSQNNQIELPYDPATPLLVIYPRNTELLVQKLYVPLFHYSIIYNKQDMEADCLSMDKWIRCIDTHKRILLSCIKEWNLAICNMDETWGCCVKWNKWEG